MRFAPTTNAPDAAAPPSGRARHAPSLGHARDIAEWLARFASPSSRRDVAAQPRCDQAPDRAQVVAAAPRGGPDIAERLARVVPPERGPDTATLVRRALTPVCARIFAAQLCAAWLCLCACSKPDAPDADDDVARPSAAAPDRVQLTAEAIARAQIRVAKLERRALSSGAAIAAEVQFDPTSTAHVGPLAAGRITHVAVELGQQVKRGDLLGVVSSGDVSSVRSRLVQARARLASANATLRRQEQLAREGIGAQRALIEAQTAVSELRAEVEGLERQLSALGSGSGEKGELRLVSPIDGVVVSVHGTLGESANIDQPVFVVTDPKRVWMRGDVPELEIPRLAIGKAAVIRLHAYPELTLTGTITYIAPALEERTRTLPIRVSIDEPDARLRGGMFGSLELLDSDHDARVLAVPVDAVTTLEGQDVVFEQGAQPNTFHPVAVTLGRRAAGYYELRAGLAEGDSIAVSGAFTLKSALRESELSDGDLD